MFKKTTLIILSLVFATNTFAQEMDHSTHDHNHKHDQADHGATVSSKTTKEFHAQCENLIDVQVNGLVCDFCARALEKVFGRNDAVQDIMVDLDNGLVRIETKPGQDIKDDVLTKMITDSGYNVTAINKDCENG